MQYCAKCHILIEEGTTCSNCNGSLAEPKAGNLIILTAAMQTESNEIMDAFRARGIYIGRQPTIEEGVYELLVQFEDLNVAKETLEIVLEDMKQHAISGDETTETAEQKPATSNRKKWIFRILAAVAFGLAIWGVVALTDLATGFVKGWFA